MKLIKILTSLEKYFVCVCLYVCVFCLTALPNSLSSYIFFPQLRDVSMFIVVGVYFILWRDGNTLWECNCVRYGPPFTSVLDPYFMRIYWKQNSRKTRKSDALLRSHKSDILSKAKYNFLLFLNRFLLPVAISLMYLMLIAILVYYCTNSFFVN